MTYHGLSKKPLGLTCPCGKKKSSVFFELCWGCQKRKNLKTKRLAAKSERARRKNDLALEKCTKLPAKNRKKSKIIDALLAGVPSSSLLKQTPATPSPGKKPKTIRYQSLEKALLLKKLESFD